MARRVIRRFPTTHPDTSLEDDPRPFCHLSCVGLTALRPVGYYERCGLGIVGRPIFLIE